MVAEGCSATYREQRGDNEDDANDVKRVFNVFIILQVCAFAWIAIKEADARLTVSHTVVVATWYKKTVE